MRTRITNILLTPGVTTETHIPFVYDAEILIEGNLIVYAGKRGEAPAFVADRTIDGQGALAMPGLCDMHTHTPMTLLRSIGSDLPLDRWLNEAIFPVEKHLTDGAVRAGTDLGIMEMLRFGITSFNDMYMHMDMEAEAVRDSGMRALLGHGVVDFDESCADLLPNIALIEKWNHAADDRIRISLAPHSEGATTRKVLEKIRDAAQRYGVPVHIHVSETKLDFDGSVERRGLTPPQYLEELGLLEHPVLAAHCVWMTDEDIELFARRGVTILHNPISNLKLASGVAPIAKMLKAGCRIALGTDGVASNNNLNLWEEIKLMPMLQKGTLLDPTVVSPAQTLAAATSVGARGLGYENLGLLKPGYLADLILVDMNVAHFCPRNDLESDLVYSIQGSDVVLTMVNGKVLYDHGDYPTLDTDLVLQRARKEAEALFERARAVNK
ncbi:MAG: amidohydrolase [Clostridiales bacterium]|nr:amidohydrolase [Clostridiales bacterium]MDY4009659.1 amidohydrolase [Candidatus Limiplasma sp.]